MDESLRNLPAHDVDPRVASRIRRRALAVLDEERRMVDHPTLAATVRVWRAWAEPALATAVSGAYLLWMFATLAALR